MFLRRNARHTGDAGDLTGQRDHRLRELRQPVHELLRIAERLAVLMLERLVLPVQSQHRVVEAGELRQRQPRRRAEHVGADVGAEVRSLPVLAHAGKADVAIDDERWREGQSVSDGNELHKRMEVTESPIAGAISNGITKAWFTMKDGLHGAVLGEEAVFGGAVEVHFGVKILARETLCG